MEYAIEPAVVHGLLPAVAFFPFAVTDIVTTRRRFFCHGHLDFTPYFGTNGTALLHQLEGEFPVAHSRRALATSSLSCSFSLAHVSHSSWLTEALIWKVAFASHYFDCRQ